MIQNDIRVRSAILLLKTLEVDGETMQYILQEVGMEDQMLRQLVLSVDDDTLVQLLQEKQSLNINKHD
jgi:hypothetical protein